MTLAEAVRAARRVLEESGIDGADLDARLLAGAALGWDRARMVTERDTPLPAPALDALDQLIARRAAREPVSRILGRREFWSLDFIVTQDVLDPRPDSETLVAAALDALPADRPTRILDLGTGSGCLLLAILSERPLCTGLGVDASPAALDVARANAAALGLAGRAEFGQGNWGRGLDGGWDMVISNPPYVESAAIAGLAPEVRDHDPKGALDGGADGLAAYGAIIADLPRLLAPGAPAFLELGAGQAAAVSALAQGAGIMVKGTIRDLGGHERCLCLARG